MAYPKSFARDLYAIISEACRLEIAIIEQLKSTIAE